MEVVEVVKETLWVTWLVRELGVEQSRVHLHYYNYGTIYLTNNQMYHVKIKHVDMGFHKIVELFASRQILLENIHISEIATDTLTKSIISDKFKHYLNLLKLFQYYLKGVVPPHFHYVNVMKKKYIILIWYSSK